MENNKDTRKISLSWKTDKVTKVKKESVSFEVSTSPINEALEDASFKPFIRGYLESMQNALARKLLEEGKPVIQVANSLDSSALLDYLTSDAESGRMTKESIGEWFDLELSELLQVAIADVLGVGDVPTEGQVKTLEAAIAGHKAKIVALAGGATTYAPNIAAKLQKAVELVGDSDVIAVRFIKRLEKMQVIQDSDMLGL